MPIKKDLIIGIGDAHFPFASKKVLGWIYKEILKPLAPRIKAVVQMGDLYDLFSYAKFPKRLMMTPREETWQARADAEDFWDRIYELVPKAKLYQIKGNHDARLMKRVVETMPELDHLIKYDELFSFEGVKTIHDDKMALELDGWHFIHGHAKEGSHIEQVDFQNVVCGHTHRGGTWSRRIHQQRKSRIITELNCGFIGNPHHEALTYRPLKKHFKWTHGVGIIDKMGGRFVPYNGDIL